MDSTAKTDLPAIINLIPGTASLQRLKSRIAFVSVIICAIVAVACQKKSPTELERPPASVRVASALTQDVPIYLDAIGKTVAREVVSIQPQVSGRVTKIHFTDGADVKTGDPLFTIDPQPFEVNLQQAQANLARNTALKRQADANARIRLRPER
jgi:multidrug efflux system membrane fusion protein